MKFSKLTINLPKLKEVFSAIIWDLGHRAFLLILLFILLDLIFSGFIFYKYVFLAELKEGRASGKVLKFDAEGYYDALDLLNKNVEKDENLIQIEEEYLTGGEVKEVK
jgi:hypothetical protein